MILARTKGSGKLNEYAMYKGDELLSVGTISEIASELFLTEKTVRYYGTPRHIQNRHKTRKVLIKLED